MDFTKGQVFHGFRMIQARESSELDGKGLWFEHIRTGNELFWLDNGQENKVFSIAFRTIPEDDTGVFHILEHSVLNGSEKYPVKEPFVELIKGSMNTFLNAMTFPDMTVFPVSSRNNRDLINLTGVYLDAVFAPACIKDERIFLQEGWHIEKDENGRDIFKGVVYNEMKGSMSDRDNLIDHRLSRLMYPDTGYGYNSGGEPECIPELTWESFKDRYHRFYHPSNAKIYLEGDIPAEEMFSLIDSYLTRFERKNDLPVFIEQTPRSAEDTIFYEISPEEDENDMAYLAIGKIIGSWKEREANCARHIICDVLTGSNEAPLKRAVLEKGLARDLTISIDDEGYQTAMIIQADRVTDGMENDIKELLRETGEKIRQEGIDRNAAEARLNRMIYGMREDEEPQGIGRCLKCLDHWFFGGDPLEDMESGKLIKSLKAMLDKGEFDALAADMLLDMENAVILHALPSRDEEKKRNEEENARIHRILSAWSDEERTAYSAAVDAMKEWQNTPDTEDELKKLPVLTREDADVRPEKINTEAELASGVRIFKHRLNCKGIIHLRLYFRLTDLSLEELTRASFFASLLGRMPTKEHDAFTLQQEIKRYTGHIGFSVVNISDAACPEGTTPYFVCGLSALKEYEEQAESLFIEILTSTVLDDEDRIREIVLQSEMSERQRIVSLGHMLGITQALSCFSSDGAVKNALDGIPALRYIFSFADNPESFVSDLRQTSKKIMNNSFVRKRLLISVTGTEKTDTDRIVSAFGEGTQVPDHVIYPHNNPENVFIKIPSQVGFAVKAFRITEESYRLTGGLVLAASMISLEYLWNRVRAKGGAYGAGLTVNRSGNIFAYSYRDPSPAATIDVFNGIAEEVKNIRCNEDNLTRYIISTLNELNPLLSPRDAGVLEDRRILTGITEEYEERIRKEILQATEKDIADSFAVLEAFISRGVECIVGDGESAAKSEGMRIVEL